MTFRSSALLSALVLFGSASAATAQPIAPPRPGFTAYPSMYRPGGALWNFYNGTTQPGVDVGVQSQLIQLNQNLSDLQNTVALGNRYGINTMLPPTGRGATFNNLGHWYPSGPGGGGGGFGGGGFAGGGGGAGIGLGLATRPSTPFGNVGMMGAPGTRVPGGGPGSGVGGGLGVGAGIRR